MQRYIPVALFALLASANGAFAAMNCGPCFQIIG